MQLKPLMEGLIMHTVDFSFTLKTNSGKVINMLAAKGYICKSDKEERIRNNLIDIDDRDISL
jgi:hypothetical protein